MESKNIIISRTDKIGDLVISIPSFYMVRKMYKDAKITLLVRGYNYDIVKNLSYIDRIIKIDEYTENELMEKIRSVGADTFIALYNDKLVGKLARASKAKRRIGPYSKLSSFFTYNYGVWQKRSRSIKNEGEYNLDLVKKLDEKLYRENFEINTEIPLDKSSYELADDFYREIEKKVVVVNPFSGGSAKNLTPKEYNGVIKSLMEKREEVEVVVVAHISDKGKLKEVVGDLDVKTFVGEGSIQDLAAIIDRGEVYLGGSTGPTHIAASRKKKIVGIYPMKKTQHPTRWGTYGWKNIIYIIPDGKNKKEDYNNLSFDCYNKKIESNIVDSILKLLDKG